MMRLLCSFSLMLLLLALPTPAVRGEPWSEKLGFPAGRPVVILDVRELGVCWEINNSVTGLLGSGHATSAGIVVTGPRFNEVAAWNNQNGDYDLGISIALTNPYDALSWRLLTSEVGPTTLVNADGFPWQNVVQFAVSASADDAKAELDAQIAKARQAGIRPTHISGYYGTLFSRPDLAAVLLGAASKYWLPAPVVELTPELIDRFRAEGFPVDEEMIALIDEYPLPKLDDLRVSPTETSYELKRDRFMDLLRTLRPGLSLVMLRPAEDSPGLRSLTPDWQQRVWDAQMLRDENIANLMKEQNIIVTDWRDVMKRFEHGPTAPTETAPASSEGE